MTVQKKTAKKSLADSREEYRTRLLDLLHDIQKGWQKRKKKTITTVDVLRAISLELSLHEDLPSGDREAIYRELLTAIALVLPDSTVARGKISGVNPRNKS